MAIAVRRREAGIEIETERLKLFVHLATLRMQATAQRDSLALRGFRPRLVAHDRSIFALVPVADGVEEAETALGTTTRVLVLCRSDSRVDLSLAIDVGQDWPGFALQLTAENRGEASVSMAAMDPLCWSRDDGGELALPGKAAERRFFRMGYQSWSPAGFVRLQRPEARPRLRLLETVHYGPFTPPPRRGHHVSDFSTSLRTPGHPGLTFGFLTHRRFLNHVALRHRGAEPAEIVARVSTEGLRVAPHESLAAERLWVGFDPAGRDGLASWAELAGTEMRAPVPAEVGSGWCSWYQYRTKLSAGDVRRNARALADARFGVGAVQIDDGFQAAVGDWLEPAAGFPEGIAPLAAEIRSRGLRPGLWLAPFLVSRASRLAHEHPGWILRSARGRPRVAVVNPAWKGSVCYALDPTHPEVLDWLREVVGMVRGSGFDYLKLDFLFAGALMGARRDPSAASAQAYRRGIEAIREAAQPDAFLVGCGAPLGPSIGLFEAVRIGPDVAPRWRSRTSDLVYGIRSAPSAENSLRNVLARASLHQRLWINDPDCVLLRNRDTRLRDHEVKTLSGAIAVSGGLVVVSDDLAKLGPERRRLLRRMLPALGLAPESGPLAGEVPEGLTTRLPDGSALVFRANLGRRVRALEIDLRQLGFRGSVHVYDVWAETPLGTRANVIRVARVPPRGSVLLRLSPADGRARVVGSSLHLSAGSIETVDLHEAGRGALDLTLQLPGPREGTIHVVNPEGASISVEVGFEDELELRLSGAGVEQAGQIPNRLDGPGEDGKT